MKAAESRGRSAARAAGVFAAAMACAVAVLCPSTLATELFGRRVSFPLGDGLRSAVAGDFNSDGFSDVAVLFEDLAGVLLGDGLGGLTHAGYFTVSRPAHCIVAADFNLDGALDLAVCTRATDSLSVALGNGSGGFCEDISEACIPDVIHVPGGPESLAAADFDADGIPDLAVALATADSVRILLGDGEGSFSSTPSDVPVGEEPWMLVADDLNLDGRTDLAVANYFDDSVSILLGDDSGSFNDTREIAVGVRPRYLASGDLDLDGKRDLAVAMNEDDSLWLLFGDGTGQFRVQPGIPVGDRPVAVSVADLDADGFPDLIVANFGDESISVLRGDGEGGFATEPDTKVGGGPTAVAVSDFDGDAALDLVVANLGGDSVDILPGDGLGGLAATPEFEVRSTVNIFDPWPRLCITVGDFNGDGRDDAAVASRKDDSISVLLGDATDGLANGPVLALSGPACSHAYDYDDDGTLDLVVAQTDHGKLRMLVGVGDGRFVLGQEIPVGGHPTSVAQGDFNGDGAPDLVVSHSLAEDDVSILLGDGQGGFSLPTEFRSCSGPPCGPLHAAVADFNGDGDSDLVVVNWLYGKAGILHGNGDGSFTLVDEISSARFRWVHAADVDGDGDIDVALCASYALGIQLLNSGTGEFEYGPTLHFSDPWYPAPGDFNDDGILDFAVSQGLSLAILLGDGTGDFSRVPEVKVTDKPVYTAAGDFNGDGATDIVAANFGGKVSLALNQLFDRADLNGSNRTDGFDLAAIGLLASKNNSEPEYQRNVDVDLDGMIDGDDLRLAAAQFGELRKEASPLQVTMEDLGPPAPDTVTFQPFASEGDLLTVQVLVNDEPPAVPAAAARFAVTFHPTDGAFGHVLEYVQYKPGSFLSGGLTQLYEIDAGSPGIIDVSAVRWPPEDLTRPGDHTLVNLIFRAKREGEALLEFAASEGYSRPTLLNAAGQEVVGVDFVGGLGVSVTTSAGEAPGQKLSVTPERLDFGETTSGGTKRKRLRLTNFGFAELAVSDARPDTGQSEFRTFFTAPFAIPPYGFVELWVEFSPTTSGEFSSELVILSNDPERPEKRVLLLGTSVSGTLSGVNGM